MDRRGQWGQRKSLQVVAVGIALLAAFSVFTATRQGWRLGGVRDACVSRFPAIFNFGDSNSDTGCVSATFKRLMPPYGRTFFGNSSGRYSDGRLIIDFIAEKLGLPYLNAYLDAIGVMGSSFRRGANFAASGSTIRPEPSMNPIHLGIQISQFEQLKYRTIKLYNTDGSSYVKSFLPRPEDFAKALYTMDTGQNDLHAGLVSKTEEQVKASIPSILDQFAEAVESLYQQGARVFWIHNTGPIGCLPFFLIHYPPKPGNTDQIGCIKSYNEVAQVFNKQLKERVHQLMTKLQGTLLYYVDIYSAKYSLISEAKQNGFIDPLGYCCGYHGDFDIGCGEKAILVNGTEVYGTSCSNPSQYISWDNIHYTEAANNWVSLQALNGSLSDTRFAITGAC